MINENMGIEINLIPKNISKGQTDMYAELII